MTKPAAKPKNPCFSSGPCAKRPGWNLDALKDAAIGRSHRAKAGKDKLAEAIKRSREILEIPDDYLLGIVPASDTGAVEMALWSLLGERGVDVVAFEAFGNDWATDLEKQLKISDLKIHKADYGKLPDLAKVDCDRDVVFTWNGTTSGVKIPNADWIKDNRKGFTICDATSAVFAMELPWKKLDVITYSWQKAMGGEAAHGVLILSPRAVARLESYKPTWPLPKIFRMTKGGKIIEGLFKGETINTPSMLCVEDAIDGLKWAESIGGLKGLVKRSEENLRVLADWVAKTPWIEFLAENLGTISSTSVCFKIVDPWYSGLTKDDQAAKAKEFASILEKENVAYDIGGYRDAPPGIRIWCGSTVESNDIRALLPWLDWAFEAIKDKAKAA